MATKVVELIQPERLFEDAVFEGWRWSTLIHEFEKHPALFRLASRRGIHGENGRLSFDRAVDGVCFGLYLYSEDLTYDDESVDVGYTGEMEPAEFLMGRLKEKFGVRGQN